MEFRPCIDIHNGKVKQIVGSSLQDAGNQAKENYVSEQDADFYARLYQSHGLRGGHIILLNPATSEFYPESKRQAMIALKAYPQGMQIGGGIHAQNAQDFLDAGASHVIVTSYVFGDGQIQMEHLEMLKREIGKEHIVLDLSCRFREDGYYIVTDRWQKFTDVKITEKNLDFFKEYCDEILIHAVDVEGKNQGIESNLVALLSSWNKMPITYAGGVHSYEDIALLKKMGQEKIHVTVGSALDIFGGTLSIDEIKTIVK